MIETFRRAHEHKGAAFVEVFQNCNVFNDAAFEDVTAKAVRDDMLIPLAPRRADPLRCRRASTASCSTRSTAPGSSRWPTSARTRCSSTTRPAPIPGVAFMLSRLARGPYEPTPIGVFRAVERLEYGSEVDRQLAEAVQTKGPGDLAALLRSGASWDVEAP